nr:hypothetical protein [Tanacetum cinerariifolium]
MCVDFKDLNTVCPKDGYPLPKIDWKVESLCGYPYKCFMDTYKGYHQIKMAEEDEEKTALITSQGIFCYSKISFGLKMLEQPTSVWWIRLSKNRLVETWREINMKLNPKKCAIEMRKGTFLEHKVDANGRRVCLDKVEAVVDLPSPKCLKDTAEAEVAFKEMKQLIAELLMLTAPKEKEELIMYLAAAKEAISAVLMTERDGKKVPIYFVIRALQGLEINYTPIEKLILALTSVKEQILADFIVERPEDDTPNTSTGDWEELPDPWILFTDGSSCIDRFGSGLIITNLEGMDFTYALRFRFNATNNEAEYEALIAGLRIAGQMEVQNLQANVDSKLVANQNKKADALSKIASTSFAHLSKQVLVEELREKTIDEKEILAVVEEGHTWMTPVNEYLTEGILPEEKKKARVVRRKAGKYAVIKVEG